MDGDGLLSSVNMQTPNMQLSAMNARVLEMLRESLLTMFPETWRRRFFLGERSVAGSQSDRPDFDAKSDK